jgi:ABC-type antimicrobial peptide transport system permease subunit
MSVITENVYNEFDGGDADLHPVIDEILYKIQKFVVRRWLLDDGKRVDGRRLDQIRPLAAEVGLLNRVHGSGMFTRGQTQVLTLATLGPVSDAQLIDGIGEETEKIKAEIDDVFNRYVQAQPKENIYTMEVEDYWQNALDCDGETTLLDAIGKYLYILLAFLFIPALNLSGMISSRMESRLDEIGVRKAYGATNGQIISQVLWENLLLTLMGTIIGLILAYVVVITGSSWITAFFDARINEVTPREINADMLLNPTVIICTLALSLLLNISSALLPTVIALKKDIVQSLYQRR